VCCLIWSGDYSHKFCIVATIRVMNCGIVLSAWTNNLEYELKKSKYCI
jgi:hypothetical protein